MIEQPVRKKTVAVIGAGPAGCATALSLKQSLEYASITTNNPKTMVNIHLFDATKSILNIGETIPPAATPLLYQLKLAELINNTEHKICPGSISVWGKDKPGYNDFLHDPVGSGYHLNRELFDQQLCEEVEKKNINLNRKSSLTRVVEEGDSYLLEFCQEGEKSSRLLADYVVDASGKASVFARRLSIARNLLDEVISLCVIVDSHGFNITETTLVEAVEHGWWYAASLPNDKMIISFCTDQENIKKFNFRKTDVWLSEFRKTKLLSKKIPQDILLDRLTVHLRVAPSSILSQVVGRNWLAVGDAASSYDSVSSAGITKALKNGLEAGKAISTLIVDESDAFMGQYQETVFREFNQYAQLRYDIYQSEIRFLDSGFWKRRR